MNLKNINHVVEILATSPLRQYLEARPYLEDNKSITLFEEERKVLNKIDDIIRTRIPEKWESIYLYASVIDVPNKRMTRRNVFLLFSQRYYKEKSSKLL